MARQFGWFNFRPRSGLSFNNNNNYYYYNYYCYYHTISFSRLHRQSPSGCLGGRLLVQVIGPIKAENVALAPIFLPCDGGGRSEH